MSVPDATLDTDRPSVSLEDCFDGLPLEVVVLDACGHIVYANQAWRVWADLSEHGDAAGKGGDFVRLLGELAGVSVGQRAGFVRRLMPVLRGQAAAAHFEVCCARGDRRQWLALDARALRSGGALVTQSDISGHKELERERERFNELADALGHYVVLFEPSGRLIYLNAAGRLLAERVGARTPDGGIEKQLDRWPGGLIGADALASALATGDWRGPLLLDTIDASTIAVDGVLHAHRGPDGDVLYLSAVLHDSSEDQRRERELRHRNVDLEIAYGELKDAQEQLLQSEKMASIGQLAAGVAHEINNPIGYVHSNLGTLHDYVRNLFALIEGYERVLRAHANAEARAEIDEIRRRYDLDFVTQDLPMLLSESRDGIERVKKIVQDLRDFSHVERSEEWTLGDLHKGLDSTLNIVSNELRYKAELVKDYGALPLVECLPMQLNQVFMNMLVNAGHAIEERGTITITTRVEGEWAVVAISDSGAGIPPALLARIFDPFFTTKPVGQGTGLGLSLSYGIVQKHHGRIEVESTPGAGTTFRIVLPLAQPRLATDAPLETAI